LSIPSTISIALSVMRVIQVCGSEISSSIAWFPVLSERGRRNAGVDQR
jgi:hypothetical protein